MTPKELFAVGLRLVGVWFAVSTLPDMLTINYLGAVPGIAGLVLITRADLIAQLCYPKDVRRDDRREHAPGDFRDS